MLLGVLAGYELFELRAFLTDAAAVRVRAQAKPIVDGAVAQRGPVTDGALADLATRLATDLTSADTGALVLDPDGTVLGRPEPGTIGAAPPGPPPADALARAAAGEREVDVVSGGLGDRTVEALIPLPGDDPPRAVIVLGTDLDAEDGVLRRQAVLVVVGISALLVLGWVIGTVLIRRALAPLRAIAGATRGIAAGDLGSRVDDGGPPDEIGDLARSVNAMAASLELAFGQVSASESRMRDFVADASHELRTPLTALGGYADVLLRGGARSDPEATERLLVGLRREVARMQRLVDDLLTLARLDIGGGLDRRTTDLVAVARAVVADVAALATGHTIVVDAPETGVAAEVDPDRCHQVLLNLVANAIRHTASDGHVTVRVAAAGPEVTMVVADDGEGMDAATRARALDRFTRGGARPGGAGLGLAIVASIVAVHEGTVALDSEPGTGTTVTVRLPRTPSGGAAPHDSGGEEPVPPPGPGPVRST